MSFRHLPVVQRRKPAFLRSSRASPRPRHDARSRGGPGLPGVHLRAPGARRPDARASAEPPDEPLALPLHLGRQAPVELSEELADPLRLAAPVVLRNRQHLLQVRPSTARPLVSIAPRAGRSPIGDSAAAPAPCERAIIKRSTRMFSPKPGQMNRRSVTRARVGRRTRGGGATSDIEDSVNQAV